MKNKDIRMYICKMIVEDGYVKSCIFKDGRYIVTTVNDWKPKNIVQEVKYLNKLKNELGIVIELNVEY